MAIALGVGLARAETLPARPDLSTAKPIAACRLQSIEVTARPDNVPTPAGFYSIQRPADDPLINYERTPLGDWPQPAAAGRGDPWVRIMLLAPARPVVIDLAVFIDGKPFREAREAWIDELLTDPPVGADGSVEAPAGNNRPDNQETETGDGTSQSADEDAKSNSTTDGATVPGVPAQARQAPTMRERLKSYLAAAGPEVDRDEIHWLVAESGLGPAVVVLDASQSWQRSGIAPLLAYLDQNADGSLSAAETEQADDLLNRADLDEDDVVAVSEIRHATRHPQTLSKKAGHALVVLLDASTDWDLLRSNMDQIYSVNSDGQANEPLRRRNSGPADITLRVDFSATHDQKKRDQALSLLSVSPDLAVDGEAVTSTTNVVAIDVDGNSVEFCAAGSPDDKTTGGSQLAIGAVIDGNPLLRLVDRDQDERLTLRERRDLPGLLTALDRNADGTVTAAEIPVPLRVAVTLGPQVHRLLAKPTAAARMIAPRKVPKVPSWFLTMDKNKDGDLSRGEFLGTTEQFRRFDENGDQLLSIAEAAKLNSNGN